MIEDCPGCAKLLVGDEGGGTGLSGVTCLWLFGLIVDHVTVGPAGYSSSASSEQSQTTISYVSAKPCQDLSKFGMTEHSCSLDLGSVRCQAEGRHRLLTSVPFRLLWVHPQSCSTEASQTLFLFRLLPMLVAEL